MTLPNFIIIGAPKCGTSSAYAYLHTHQEAFLPGLKEIHFFSPMALFRRINSLDEYQGLFRDGPGKKAIGEASPSYLYDPDAPRMIHEVLGDEVKLVAFLRNPVDAAYSLWASNIRFLIEPLSFAEALTEEPNRIGSPEFAEACLAKNVMIQTRFYYTNLYKYAPQLKRYLDIFPRTSLKIFIFENFFTPGLPQYPELCTFLNLSDDHRPDERVYNSGSLYRSRWLQGLVRNRTAWKDPIRAMLPKPVRILLRNVLTKANALDVPPLPKEQRQSLQEVFRSDVRQVEQLLDRDLSQVWF